MTIIIFSIFNTLKINLRLYLFLVLITMFFSNSATSQVIADFTTISSTTGCGSLVVDFKDLSTGSPNTWLWDFGNGNTSTLQNPSAIYTTPGIYDVTLTVDDLLSNNTKILNGYIKVFENPVANLSLTSSNSGCIPFTVNFSDVSNSSVPITNWLWDFGDGGSSILQDPSYEYLSGGLYTVSLSVLDSNGCQSIKTEIDATDIKEMPVASFNSNLTSSCSQNENVLFTNNSTGASNYLWDFGDGTTSTLTNPNHNYSAGIYDVTLLAKSGICIDTLKLSDYIEIGISLTPNFTSNVNSGCENLLVEFTDITNHNPNTWLWDFGDGNTSNQQNPSNNYLDPGIYNISLTTSISGQCTRTLTYIAAIEVFNKPEVEFSIDTTYGCDIPFNINLRDNTSDAISRNWSIGNGVISHDANPMLSLLDYGWYDISLTVINDDGCASNLTIDSLVHVEKIVVDFSSDINNGCKPLAVNFIDNTYSARPIHNWNWNFGDGTSSILQSPFHQYNTTDSFHVSLEIVNDYGCIANNTTNNFIIVDDFPMSSFSISHNIACVGQHIDFLDLSTSLGLINTWFWDFGDGNTSVFQNPTHQYQNPGIYDVSLISGVNSCKDTILMSSVIEIVEPNALFDETHYCDNPYLVDFINFSSGSDSVFWDFGDGTTSTLFNPSHTFTSRGNYIVTLSATNFVTGCTNEFTKDVTITVPQANFDYLVNTNHNYNDSIGCKPHTVFLENLSQDYSYYKVIWSDGDTVNGRIDHTFNSEGSYDVKMIITDIHGCKDTMEYKNMYRINDVNPDFNIINSLGCDSLLVNFEDLTFPSSSVFWNFGDGGTSSSNNPQHIYHQDGLYDVSIYVESLDGCKDTLIREEYIEFQYPEANFSSSTQALCPNDNIVFSNFSSGVSLTYLWDFGDGNQSNSINPQHQYNFNDVYDVSLTVVDSFGCSNNVTFFDYIEVQKPQADFITSAITSDCPPLISNFSNISSSDVTDWYWDFGDGGQSTIENPSHLFNNSGSYDITLVVENNLGCLDTIVKDNLITISGPTGTFSFSDSLVCKGSDISFLSNVDNTNIYFWDFGDGSFSNDSFPIHSYSDTGKFIPSLIIQNLSGCQKTINGIDTIYVRSIFVDAGPDTTICRGEFLQLNAIGDFNIFTWSTSVGLSDSSISNPIFNHLTDITYFLQHTDGFCFAYDTITINIDNNIPDPSFLISNTCENDTAEFQAFSGLPNNNFSWNWNFGDTLQNVKHLFGVGTHEIVLIVENLDNNCSDTLIQNINIYPKPIANFLINDVCLGDTTYFQNISSNDVISWLYNMGDGNIVSNEINPQYVYLDTGVFTPQLTVTSIHGCENDFFTTVNIYELPIADFIIKNNCLGTDNIFTDNSTINNGNIISYNFDFGDGSYISNNPISYHQYIESGLYNVQLTVVSDNGCISEVVKQSNVYPLPIVDFNINGYCLDSESSFNSTCTIANGSIDSLLWDFGDGNFNYFSQNPTHSYSTSGIYPVVLTAISDSGCISKKEEEIIINENPIAFFSTDSTACIGDMLNFIDLSYSENNEIIKWEWEMGDGIALYDQNPVHIYNYPNLFDVSLTITSSDGCVGDTLIPAIVAVSDLPTASFDVSSSFASELNAEIEFYNNSLDAVNYFWDFDNGQYSEKKNPVVDFNNLGNYEVILSVENNFGCIDEFRRIVHITPEYSIYIPNSFTPNGDGDNDLFLAKGNGIVDFNMKIFDRWGGIVFFSNDINYGWDGLDKNNDFSHRGTYLYHISLQDYNGKTWVYNGELNLFK